MNDERINIISLTGLIRFNTLFDHFVMAYFFGPRCTLILPASELQTQQLMTSQIRSHIKYLTQAYSILVLILYSKFYD